jgi:CDP-diacylglycerol--glycerol-3-phosphate 3-phosphatidyltransferase
MSAADHSANSPSAGNVSLDSRVARTEAGYNGRHAAAALLAARDPMNLPNALTLARIVLVPLLVVVLLTKFEGHMVLGIPKSYVAAGIFGIASLTDWLDGYLARRRQQITLLGQLLDPVADKLLISAALVSLVQLGVAPAWMAAIIIGRELAVTGLRGVAQTRGLLIPSSPLGKIKMGAEVVAILLLILGQEWGAGAVRLGQIALWLVLGVALWSAVEYYRMFSAPKPKTPVAEVTPLQTRRRA